jgi:hypothetical protein
MASLKQKIEAEHGVRELLKQNGMPQPDGVEYGYGCIRLFFDEPKVVLVVDIDRPEDGYGPTRDEDQDRFGPSPDQTNGSAPDEMEDAHWPALFDIEADYEDDEADDYDFGYLLPRDDEPNDLRPGLN